jgi:hypothetical protein
MKYILIAFILLGCHNIHRKSAPKISTEALDTIKSAPARIVATPVLFETAFIKGTTQKAKDSTFKLYGITIGKIKIVSGHVVICDPMHIDEYGIPFTQVFPTGEFPVQLSIARLGNEELTAFARINFSEEPVERWEFALQKGQAPIPVGGKEMHGYGVDGSVAIFIDEEASKVLDRKTVADFNGEVFKEMQKHYHDMWKYTMYNFGKYNLAAFSTGLGDGRYATYIGFDAKGQPCRLLTDFRLFDWASK